MYLQSSSFTLIYLNQPSITFIYRPLPSITFIYRHLPSFAFIYRQLHSFTFIYHKSSSFTLIYLHSLPTTFIHVQLPSSRYPPRNNKAPASDMSVGPGCSLPQPTSEEGPSGLQPHNTLVKGPVSGYSRYAAYHGSLPAGGCGEFRTLGAQQFRPTTCPQPAPGGLVTGRVRAGCRRKLVPATG